MPMHFKPFSDIKLGVFEILLITIVYVLCARLGQVFSISPGNVTPVWLPSGIMLALAYIRGPRVWPGIFLGALIGNAWAYISFASPSTLFAGIFAGVCNGLGDVISTVVVVRVLTSFNRDFYPLNSFKEFALFLALAVLVGPACSALLGVSSLSLVGFIAWSDYLFALTTWWTGDGVGVLALAPLILAWHRRFIQKKSEVQLWKTLVLISMTMALGAILFEFIPVPQTVYLFCLTIAPLFMLASLYLEAENCLTAMVTFASVSVIATSQFLGPFVNAARASNLIELQLFIAVIATVMCSLSVIETLRLKAKDQLEDREKLLREAQEIAGLGTWKYIHGDDSFSWSNQVYQIFELSPGEFAGTYRAFIELVHPDDRQKVIKKLANAMNKASVSRLEHRIIGKNDQIKYLEERLETRCDHTGRPDITLGSVVDITNQKLAEEQLYHRANYDNLTGLPNRFLSLDRLSQFLKEADRDNCKVAVLFLDLDNFKRINDTFGHDVGDGLLIEVAKRLRDKVRAVDTVGRLGGDEFLVLLRGLSELNEAQRAIKMLFNAFESPFVIKRNSITATASVGVVMYPSDGKNKSEVLRCADTAMYYAKDAGKNSYSFFTKEMNKQLSRRLEIEKQMKGAIARGEFSVHYQTQEDLKNHEVYGAEALLRWNNSELGNVAPSEFIPIAEQTGMSIELGQLVIKDVIELLKHLQNTTGEKLSISINMSLRQLIHADFLNFVRVVLQDFNISADSLILEIDEKTLMGDINKVDEVLEAAHKLGVRIALDDFGVGSASLNHLARHPFDAIKIDQSFIHELSEDNEGKVGAAIAMAHALGLQVVAEGVETQSQLTLLENANCEFAQGYYYSEPIPREAFLAYLAKPDTGGDNIVH